MFGGEVLPMNLSRSKGTQSQVPISGPGKLLLTHWEPEIYLPREIPVLLPELIINALLYGEVLIKDGDLVLNEHIARYLHQEGNFSVFRELIEGGGIKISTLPQKNYPQKMTADPKITPITARAEEISSRKTFKERVWKPTGMQRSFYAKLDGFLQNNPSSPRPSQGFPAGFNPFADLLAKILVERTNLRLDAIPQFKGIDDELADHFIKFCRGEMDWIQFLRDRGTPPEKIGEEGKFYRSPAYQCLEHFPDRRGMKNLIQSVFAACYCDSVDADGRFGGRLVEIPYKYASDGDAAEAVNEAKSIQIIKSSAAINFPLLPGIGEVLATTRKSTACQELQDYFLSMQIGPMGERDFWSLWEQTSEIFAENVARKFVKLSRIEKGLWKVSPLLYVAGRVFGSQFFPSIWNGTEWKPILIHSGSAWSLSNIGPKLSKLFRSALRIRKVREDLVRGVKVRYSKVPLAVS
jgi:hypothetical protein